MVGIGMLVVVVLTVLWRLFRRIARDPVSAPAAGCGGRRPFRSWPRIPHFPRVLSVPPRRGDLPPGDPLGHHDHQCPGAHPRDQPARRPASTRGHGAGFGGEAGGLVDTLAVWREGAGGRLTPETDGVIGGRFRGLLTRQGGFAATDAPFVPDDLAQCRRAGQRARRSPAAIASGGAPAGRSTRDDFGTAFLRVPDGIVEGRRVERYRLVRQGESEEVKRLPDSTRGAGPPAGARDGGDELVRGTWDWCAGNGR